MQTKQFVKNLINKALISKNGIAASTKTNEEGHPSYQIVITSDKKNIEEGTVERDLMLFRYGECILDVCTITRPVQFKFDSGKTLEYIGNNITNSIYIMRGKGYIDSVTSYTQTDADSINACLEYLNMNIKVSTHPVNDTSSLYYEGWYVIPTEMKTRNVNRVEMLEDE